MKSGVSITDVGTSILVPFPLGAAKPVGAGELDVPRLALVALDMKERQMGNAAVAKRKKVMGDGY